MEDKQSQLQPQSKFPPRWPGGTIDTGLRISGRQELRRRAYDGATIVWQNIQFVDSTEWVIVEVREGDSDAR